MNTKIFIGILAVVVLGVAGWYMLNDRTEAPTPVSSAPQAQTKNFTLRIAERKIIEGPTTLTVKQGDTVTIAITADEADEFHIHGYDQSAELEPGVETTLTYTASASGRFPFELEKSGTELGAIEVLP